MRFPIATIITTLLFTQSVTAETLTLVVPRNDIEAIHNGIKITRDNMAVRKFKKADLPDTTYLVEKDFDDVINKTVSTDIRAGDPIPTAAIIPLWQEFESSEGGFKVDMPGKTINKILKGKVDENTTINMHTFTTLQGHPQLKQGLNTYQIYYMDYPPDKFPDSGKKSMLSKTRDTNMEYIKSDGANVKVIDESDITLEGHSGLESNIVADYEKDEYELHIFQRIYQVGHRQYFLSVLSANKPTAVVERTRFFNSFKLLNP